MRVLFDTNVLLDVLLSREPHAEPAARLLSLADTGRIQGVLSATTVTTIHYLATKAVGRKAATRHVQTLLSIFEVAVVDREVLEKALNLAFDDFEDAVLHAAAVGAGAGAIVTRNGKDFARATLPILDPPELLAAVLATEL